jgi:serine/threonine-protein kinase
VTPGNVIVLYTGAVKLVDFGVARVRTSVDDGLVKGKTGYLAPELLDGAKADRRSDIWSLGVVLWESLTLRRLFHGKTDEEAIVKIRSGQVPPPSSMSPAVPRDLDEVCFQAMARDPAKRYRTAASMQADLNEILRHASWSGGTEPIGRFMRGLFADRIDARKQLLRELATGRHARMTTLERLNAAPEEASPSADDGRVVGSHGTAPRGIPIAPAPAHPDELAQVQVIEMDDADDAPRLSTPAPTGRMQPVRRRRAIAIAAGVMVIAVIGVAFAMSRSPGPSIAAAPDAGARGAELAGRAPVAALDAGAEPEPIAAVEPEPAPDPEPEPEPAVDTKRESDRHRRHRDRDDDRPTPKEPEDHGTPSAAPATAKSLYKEGLRTFVSGDVGGAIALFDRARARDAGYAPTYRGLGMAYEKRGDRKRAARWFAKYLDLAPDAADAAAIAKRLERLR